MSDINLLPVSDREKEKKEKEKKDKKKGVRFEMTNPERKRIEPEVKSGGFWGGLRDKLSRMFKKEKKESKQTEKVTEDALRKIGEERINKKGVDKSLDIQTKKHKEIKPVVGQPVVIQKERRVEPEKVKQSELSGIINQGFNINLIPAKEKGFITGRQRLRVLVTTVVFCIIGVLIVCLSYKYILIEPNKKKFVSLDNEIDATKQQIAVLKIGDDKKREFLNTLKQMKGIMDGHVYFSKIFDFLEKNTLKEIYFEEMKVDTDSLSLILSARAKDYKMAAEQLLYLQSLEEIEEVQLRQVRSGSEDTGQEETVEGEFVLFNLLITLSPGFFYR